ncbi:MAG TPA: LytR C-terminal domain-containing protein [Pseudonocardiaceae bacterium]|nr:LytR C-terminal domain-containing protein [Pseudonocardiaceae bacterium]
MSASPTGPIRPARLAGFILLGVAVVAVGLGIFALADSAAGQTSSAPPTSQHTAPETITTTTTTPKPTTTTPAPTTTTTPPTTSYPSGQTTTVVAPPPANTGPPAPPPVQVRVYNNGTIKGLAARAAADLQSDGFNVVQVGNYAQGNIPTTTVYYTSAPGEQDTAQAIASKFGMRVEPRFPGIADASPGVIVIITNDFKGQ